MTTASYRCPELAEMVERLLEGAQDDVEATPDDEQFCFVCIIETPESPAITGDSASRVPEVSAQTISALYAKERYPDFLVARRLLISSALNSFLGV